MSDNIEIESWFIGNILVNTVVFTFIRKGCVIRGSCEQDYDLRYCVDTDLCPTHPGIQEKETLASGGH